KGCTGRATGRRDKNLLIEDNPAAYWRSRSQPFAGHNAEQSLSEFPACFTVPAAAYRKDAYGASFTSPDRNLTRTSL
ncbi:uncharacterized protein METZ01_LOCUS163753, partial [marine metagenome]